VTITTGEERTVARKSSIGGFTFVQRGLTSENYIKTSLIYSVSRFGGACKPAIATRGNRSAGMERSKTQPPKRSKRPEVEFIIM